jgi:hypothetical protein
MNHGWTNTLILEMSQMDIDVKRLMWKLTCAGQVGA